jgi:asparagine synthase (glutamine-hydrolysing)
MCGIAGALVTRDTERYARLVDEMVQCQVARGPDHQASARIRVGEACALLGHDRLSIIDLSAAAHQPMWDAERRFCLTYNGEVYNYRELRTELEAFGHRFRTSSDSEVIIEAFRAWGAEAVPRFNGMFAFGLLDVAERRLWLVRDRFGIKPLLYHHGPGGVAFGSTGRSIARAMGLGPDLEYVARGVHYWLYEDGGESTQYEGVRAVPAGHLLRVELSPGGGVRVHTERWYDLEARVRGAREELARVRVPELKERLDTLLRSSVDLRLRSDVPVGVSLSGGVDSASVAALLAERHEDVRGISFSHPDAPESEGPLVKQVVRATGIAVEYVWPEPREVVDAFWKALEAQDAPFPGASIVAQYMVFAAARRLGLKVMLGGQGGDEVLMGYQKFQFLYLREAVRGGRWGEAARAAGGLAAVVASDLPRIRESWAARRRYTGVQGIAASIALPPPGHVVMGAAAGEPLWKRQARDVTQLSLPTLLRYEDRNSMGNGIESRLPFLDYRVVEMGVALPAAAKVRGGYGKWLLRQTMRGRVPAAVLRARRKSGFGVSQDHWIDAGLGAAIRERIRSSLGTLRGFVGEAADVDRLFADGELKRSSARMAEATALIWMAGVL